MSKKISIAIDLDDTTNTLVDDWLVAYNKEYNDHLTIDDIKSWEIKDYVKPECGNNIFSITARNGWFDSLGIRNYAKEVIKFLTDNFEVYIVTAYHPGTCVDKHSWIKRNLPSIKNENIVFCIDKSIVNCDYLIDDRDKNIIEFKQKGIIFDKPWNRKLDGYDRVKDWDDIRMYFEKVLEVK